MREILPRYHASPEPFGPFLVFKPEDVLELLETAEARGMEAAEHADDDAVDVEDPRFELPSPERLDEFVAEHLGLSFAQDPLEIVKLAVIGITNAVWRNTSLEDLHAGDHPSGGFPDADMMRYNIATTRVVSGFVTPQATDWTGLRAALTDPDRVLPGGITVGQLAGDEFGELADDIEGGILNAAVLEVRHGRAYVLTSFAFTGGMSCKGWFGSPWWADVVEVFIELLADRESVAWRRDDGSRPEPASVVDRDALAALLLTEPERLDDAGIYWCLRHELADTATYRGYARWRSRRDPAWEDPDPWLSADR